MRQRVAPCPLRRLGTKKQAIDHTPSPPDAASDRPRRYVSRGAMEHHAIGSPSTYPRMPMGTPSRTRSSRAERLASRSLRLSPGGLERHTMHQQYLGPPRAMNSQTKSSHVSESTPRDEMPSKGSEAGASADALPCVLSWQTAVSRSQGSRAWAAADRGTAQPSAGRAVWPRRCLRPGRDPAALTCPPVAPVACA